MSLINNTDNKFAMFEIRFNRDTTLVQAENLIALEVSWIKIISSNSIEI